MLALVATTIGSLALLALAFVPLERAFPARPGQPVLRPAVAVDVCFFFGQYLVFSVVSLSILLGARGLLGEHVPRALRDLVGGWPSWLQAVVAVAIGDVLVYWFHRACHTFEPLWRFHAVHHSSEHLDFLAAHREHPVDGILTQLAVNLPAFVMGFPLEQIGELLAFRGMWALFIHANVSLPLGPLRVLFGAPELHHFHHARVARMRHNFSNLAPWVDVLFGTYHRPRGPETYPLGLTTPWPRGYLAQLAHPLKVLRRPDPGARE
jgi:sterol desaturase/sphingolipid hydroxylase (fatty acid hydroxylase superfamily)